MNTLRHTDASYAEKLSRLASHSSLFDPVIEQRARDILEAVRTRGDEAVLELTARFDGARLTATQLAIGKAELLTASLKADASLRAAVQLAHRNIAA